jgi:hypothetical protein
LEAQVALLAELMKPSETPTDLAAMKKATRLKLAEKEGILNFINGAKTETDNLTKLYSSYFTMGTEDTNEDGAEAKAYIDNEQYVNAVYQKEAKDGN